MSEKKIVWINRAMQSFAEFREEAEVCAWYLEVVTGSRWRPVLGKEQHYDIPECEFVLKRLVGESMDDSPIAIVKLRANPGEMIGRPWRFTIDKGLNWQALGESFPMLLCHRNLLWVMQTGCYDELPRCAIEADVLEILADLDKNLELLFSRLSSKQEADVDWDNMPRIIRAIRQLLLRITSE